MTGCATDPTSTDGASPSGGKADSASSTLSPLSDSDLAGLAAIDVESFDRFSTSPETFSTGIKLMCFDQGSVSAPVVCYLGVASPREAGQLREVFRLPSPARDEPRNVRFEMQGSEAILDYDVPVSANADATDVVTRHITAAVAFSGTSEAPQIVVSASSH